MRRLFFALQPAPIQGDALIAAAAPLIVELEGQPVPASNLHATLCFIGAVPDENLATLRAAAAQVHGPHATLSFDALEYWEKPEILCATADECASIRDLSVALANAAVIAGCSPDLKPFRAHLTLARKVRPRVAEKHIWPRTLVPPLRMHCEQFVLMESRKGEVGSIYSAVESWPLYAANNQ